MPISHRHIEVFRAIMATGSVTAAASSLHTSQPTISRELARFEQLISFRLFDRIQGRLHPTARALSLFDEVQRSYLGLDRIISTAKGLARFEGGQLSIVCVPAFSQALLPAACRRLHEKHDGVRISITPEESPLLEEWLSAQRHDLGLTEHDQAPPGTTLEHLLTADEVCVLPNGHPLSMKEVLEPRDFAGERFVSLSPADPYRLQVDETFTGHGITRKMALETHSAVSVCSLVREGLGVAIVNPLTALAFNGSGISIRKFSVSVPFRVSMVTPSHRPTTPLTDLFKTALKEEAFAIQDELNALSAPPGV